MVKKIFFKNRKYKNIGYFLLFTITIIILFYYYIDNFYNKTFFQIPPFDEKRYVVFDNLGGKKIPDFGINILESLSDNDLNYNYNLNLKNIIYSIQLEVSDSLKVINSKIDYYENNEIIDSNKFFVGEFNSNFGKKFILLYNNYDNRELAQKNCDKLKPVLTKCIIINVEKLKNL